MTKTITKVVILFVILITTSCTGNVAVTEKESKAIKEVLNFYNGKCHRSKGFETKNGETKNYFELEMKKSDLLEKNKKRAKSHAGNVAHLFYSNLEDEKSNYNQIRVKITLNDDTTSDYVFSDEQLKGVEKIIPKVQEVNAYIETDNIDALADTFNKSILLEKKVLAKLFVDLKDKYGIIKKSEFQGFTLRNTKQFGKITSVYIAQVREKAALSMILLFNSVNHELLSIEFE